MAEAAVIHARRAWWRALALALLAALAITACFSPRFGLWRGLGIPDLQVFPEVNRAQDALRQLEAPLAPIANPSNRAIEWRLLFPFLGYALHLPPRFYLALPGLGCLATLLYGALLLQRHGWRSVETLPALLVIGSAPWFFVSTGWLAYFDSWVVLALLVCTFTRSRVALGGACLLAPWIDERFLFFLPLCLLLRPLAHAEAEPAGVAAPQLAWKIALAAVAPYLALRAGVLVFGTGRDAAAMVELARSGRPALPWNGYFWGSWEGLRLAWIPVAWFLLRGPAPPRVRGLLALVTALTLVVLFSLAADFSRTAGMLPPLALLALIHCDRIPGVSRRRLLWILAVASLALPAGHVVNDSRVALRSVRHELTAWRQPPEFLQPDRYNVRATERLIAGDPSAALHQLEYALQLDPSFTPALINRSTALGRLGRWDEAQSAAAEALLLAPTEPRAWYARAQARRGAGDKTGALADARRALELAPPGHPFRATIETWLADLRPRL
ncbi:MAG: tetratricopeptide repeat protein [Verrucomicrobia bacterium]|nr:tetratricopeptide repeat protein [Verrucomicrobiota bacterium]